MLLPLKTAKTAGYVKITFTPTLTNLTVLVEWLMCFVDPESILAGAYPPGRTTQARQVGVEKPGKRVRESNSNGSR